MYYMKSKHWNNYLDLDATNNRIRLLISCLLSLKQTSNQFCIFIQPYFPLDRKILLTLYYRLIHYIKIDNWKFDPFVFNLPMYYHANRKKSKNDCMFIHEFDMNINWFIMQRKPLISVVYSIFTLSQAICSKRIYDDWYIVYTLMWTNFAQAKGHCHWI
jgi:hypothetical protein